MRTCVHNFIVFLLYKKNLGEFGPKTHQNQNMSPNFINISTLTVEIEKFTVLWVMSQFFTN